MITAGEAQSINEAHAAAWLATNQQHKQQQQHGRRPTAALTVSIQHNQSQKWNNRTASSDNHDSNGDLGGLGRHVMMQGPKACMGPGTGLGQANLYWSENFGDYRVWPSEGAHASFAPRGWKQRALQTHVERQLGYCEVEHVSLSNEEHAMDDNLTSVRPGSLP